MNLAAREGQTIAAVDLGSNSFHMIVARLVGGRPSVIDKLRERVQLAAGLKEDGSFDTETRTRAIECLQRFGQRLAQSPPSSVRAVGTYSLRRAARTAGFREEASEALGHPIEVIAGQEEARLIYLGVAHDVAPGNRARLVVDIGGGSTECILGQGFDVHQAQSLHMGCVSYTQEFFRKGRLGLAQFDAARVAARLQLRSLEHRYREEGWDECIGSSGTINEIDAVLRANDWGRRGITRKGLLRLRDALLDQRRIDDVSIAGLTEDRRPVLPGGLAVLLAVFEALRIKNMTTSGAALREGILHDLIGRIGDHDIREETIQGMARRYQVDAGQADRVRRTAAALLAQVVEPWRLDGLRIGKVLAWSSSVHEIGLSVARGGYHKHGAYLMQHADMPGFSRDDQNAIALLVRSQRRKLSLRALKEALGVRRRNALRVVVLFRLAVRLNRNRTERPTPGVGVDAGATHLTLTFPDGWLDEHPLSRADLEAEADFLSAVGFELTFE